MSVTTLDEITSAITEIVAAEIGVCPGDLAADTELRAVEGVDSVKVLRTVAKIERRYHIELRDEDVFELNTISQLATVVEKTLADEREQQ